MPSVVKPPPLPGSENQIDHNVHVPDLESYSLEKAERELIEASREREKTVLEVRDEVDTVEVNGHNIVVFTDKPEDVLQCLRDIETHIKENGIHIKEDDAINELFDKIAKKYPDNKEVIDRLNYVRGLSSGQVGTSEALESMTKGLEEAMQEVLPIPLIQKKETKPKTIPTVTLLENNFRVPLEDIEEARKILEKIKELAEKNSITQDEEIQLLEFLQEIEKAYPNATELDGLIADIANMGRGKEETANEPAPVSEPPTVPPLDESVSESVSESASEPKKSEKPKNRAELQLADETYKIAARDAKKAIKTLKKIRGKILHSETTLEEKAEVNRFLDEVSSLYQDSTAPDDLIAEIRDILVKPKAAEEVAQEAPFESPTDSTLPDPSELGTIEPELAETRDSEVPKEVIAPSENIDKVVSDLIRQINQSDIDDVYSDFAELNFIITLIQDKNGYYRNHENYGLSMQKYFGTEDIEEVRKRVAGNAELAKFFEKEMVTGALTNPNIVLKRLIEGEEGQKTFDLANGAIKHMLGRIRDLKIEEQKDFSTDASAKSESPTDSTLPDPSELGTIEPELTGTTDSETPKEKTAPEDINKTVENLLQTLEGLPEFRDLNVLIRLLKTRPTNVPDNKLNGYKRGMQFHFGTEDVRTIRDEINKGDNEFLKKFINQPMLNQDGLTDERIVLKRLIEGLEGEKTYAVALDAVNDMLSTLQELKIKDRKSSSTSESPAESETTPEAKTEAPADTLVDEPPTGPAPAETKTAEPTDEAKADEAKKPDKTPDATSETAPEMPKSLARAIEKAAEGDDKKMKKLLDLWGVYKGKSKLKDKLLAEDVRMKMGRVVQFSESDQRFPVAVKILKKLLTETESANVLPITTEDVNFDRLRTLVDTLTASKGLEKLRERLNDMFRILEIDPADHPKHRDTLESIQKDIEKILLQEIPTKIGIGDCDSVASLLNILTGMGYRDLKRSMQNISDLLVNDKEVTGMIEDFYNLINEKKPTGTPSTPPTTPSSGGGSAGASSSVGTFAGSRPGASTLLDDLDEEDDMTTVRADADAPDTASSDSESADEQGQREGTEFESETLRIKAINEFIKKRGYDINSPEPAIMAIRRVLGRIETKEELADLDRFLTIAAFEDEIDIKYKDQTLDELKIERKVKSKQLQALEADIDAARTALSRRSATVQETEALRKDLKKYAEEKHDLSLEMSDMDKAIERKTLRKNKETIHYRNPLQLLGMINMHFAKKAAGTDTPDYEKILETTQEQLEEARQMDESRWKWLPWNVLKPTLSGTLQMVVENDSALKKIKPEYAAALAKNADKPKGVDAWIQGLDGSEKENMEKTIPALIAHLSIAVNEGNVANINAFSVNSARQLLRILRQAVHEYSMRHAETHSGTSLDKMSAYFTEMNDINRKAVSREDIVTSNSRKKMWANIGKTAAVGSVGIGALAMAGLSAPVLFGASVAGMAVPLTYTRVRVENPKTKEILDSVSKRVIATGVLGGLTMASLPSIAASVAAGATVVGATGGLVLSAAPLLIPAIIAGAFAPEIKKAAGNKLRKMFGMNKNPSTGK